MTTDNTHIDRAIEVADRKVKERDVQKQKRRHARVLVDTLIDNLERPVFCHDDNTIVWEHGFNAALALVKIEAGIQGTETP